MAQNKVNMSLDDIIKANNSRNPVRGRGRGRGRGAFRGGRGKVPSITQRLGRGGIPSRPGRMSGRIGRGVGRGGASVVRGRSRSRSQGRAPVRGGATRGRGGPRGRLSRRDTMPNTVVQSRGRSRSRTRFQQNNNNQSRSRSRSQSRNRLNNQAPILRGRGRGRGFGTRGISTNNKFNRVGLRSDQILKAQKLTYVQNKINRARANQSNLIQTQTFTRSRSRSRSRSRVQTQAQATRLTISVANDRTSQRRPLSRKRRNSVSNNQIGYLNKAALAQLAEEVIRRGPGSVRSMGSNRSRRSNRSSRSGRGRGRGSYTRPVLNPRLQQEIAAIQGKAFSNGGSHEVAISGLNNFAPTPHRTLTSLSDRFTNM